VTHEEARVCSHLNFEGSLDPKDALDADPQEIMTISISWKDTARRFKRNERATV